MKQTEFRQRKAEIRSLYDCGNADEGSARVTQLVGELHSSKNYNFIVELFRAAFIKPTNPLWTFEVAYALNDQGTPREAEQVYEYVLKSNPNDSSTLNNLSNIKKNDGKLDDAFDLIKRAFKISPEDEVVSKNHDALLSLIQERDEKANLYKQSLTRLAKENEFVISKLSAFFLAAKKDKAFRENQLAIPKWKFKVMMATDEQKSESLLKQWLDKGYLVKTGLRGEYQEHVYELNPLLLAEIPKLKPRKLNPKWILGLERLSPETLDELGYFRAVERIGKTKRSVRDILLRDVDELFLNYVIGNHKSVVILSGSIVEMLLIYFCEKKGLETIRYQSHNKEISKSLYAADLGDLLSLFEEENYLGDIVVHMGNISRIYRNFVHPGKELREQIVLDQAKSNLCFVSTLEILTKVCT